MNNTGKSTMVAKIGKIILTAILSFVFFIVAAILVNWIAGLIVGTDNEGNATANGYLLMAITSVISLVFAVWFYKFVAIKKH